MLILHFVKFKNIFNLFYKIYFTKYIYARRIYDKIKNIENKLYNKIEKIAKKEGIPIIKYYFRNQSEIGLNNFIDIIKP